jgi:glucosyl-dolichyl phosphate glucuronosyltransferase
MANPVSITIAICTWNRCQLLQRSLEQLIPQTCPEGFSWHVVVVNNNCTDATSDVIRSFEDRLNIREASEPVPGLSNARNRALSVATGDYIAWTDDDVLVAPDWIAQLCAGITAYPDAAGFGGVIEPLFPEQPDPTLLAAFPVLATGFCGLNHGPQMRVLAEGEQIFGANMAYSMRAATGIAFDPKLGVVEGVTLAGEEEAYQNELRRRGGAMVWLPAMRVRHFVEPFRMQLDYLVRYAYDRGRTLMRMHKGANEPQILGAPRWAWMLMARAYLRYLRYLCTSNREAALSNLREFHNMRGMVAEGLSRLRT